MRRPPLDDLEFETRVRSYELDPYDHVNNGAYVNWFEDAREQFIRARDRTWMWYPQNLDLHFVVVHVGCDYRSAVLAGETLIIRTRLARIGERSLTFRQSLRRPADASVPARARVVMCFSRSGRAEPIPVDFKERFVAHAGGDLWLADEGGERG